MPDKVKNSPLTHGCFNLMKGCFHILCCFSIIFTLITRVDFRCRYSLSAGGLRSLLSALHLRGLPQHAFPAGVSHLPLQSTSVRIGFLLKQQSLRKEPNEKMDDHRLSIFDLFCLLYQFFHQHQ